MRNNNSKIGLIFLMPFILFVVFTMFIFASIGDDETLEIMFSLIPIIMFVCFAIIIVVSIRVAKKSANHQSIGDQNDSNSINEEFIHPSNHEDHTIIKQEGKVKCPKCFKDNSNTKTFCEYCGEKLDKECPFCYERFPAIHRFCPKCGKRVK